MPVGSVEVSWESRADLGSSHGAGEEQQEKDKSPPRRARHAAMDALGCGSRAPTTTPFGMPHQPVLHHLPPLSLATKSCFDSSPEGCFRIETNNPRERIRIYLGDPSSSLQELNRSSIKGKKVCNQKSHVLLVQPRAAKQRKCRPNPPAHPKGLQLPQGEMAQPAPFPTRFPPLGPTTPASELLPQHPPASIVPPASLHGHAPAAPLSPGTHEMHQALAHASQSNTSLGPGLQNLY